MERMGGGEWGEGSGERGEWRGEKKVEWIDGNEVQRVESGGEQGEERKV